MKKLEIEIPVDKEVDWEASAKQKHIVLKDKPLTYKAICDKLFEEGHYFIDSTGYIRFFRIINDYPNSAFTEHQLKCILAKNMLANVARYLNGDWSNYHSSHKFIIWINTNENDKLNVGKSDYLTQRATVIFKSEELAKQAIEILGEETVKLALEPLY
jgi:hypothetical protein